MMTKRRKHSGAFKAKVALEALKGVKTINEIAAEHEVHPVQVSQWKKELQERLPGVFEKPRRGDAAREREETERLERKVGQLTMEIDWLKKTSERLQTLDKERQ